VRRDIHRQTAAAFAGIPLDQVTKEQRQNAKPFSFAAIYGGRQRDA
jgi:DNA polymerase-1